jgi:hypothetical protein
MKSNINPISIPFFYCDNLIKNEMKLVYETEFSINSISKDEIKNYLKKS